MDMLKELEAWVEECGTAPLYEEMPRKTLADKGAAGPTAAHALEEIHTPLNIAYTTYTTGTSAFQNPVGIVYEELEERTRAGIRALKGAGISEGGSLLIAYPPLVNVFGVQALRNYKINWSFLRRSSRDGLLAALCRRKPEGVIGESTFLKAALEDSVKMGISGEVPENLKVIAAGTPLDLELLETAKKFPGMEIHDLYGCQEFGWLSLDGCPLRGDLHLLPCGRSHYRQVSVGGLLTGDCFPQKCGGHLLNPSGTVISYGRKRMEEEWVPSVLASTAADAGTVRRMARSILRLKAKILRVSENIRLNAEHTIVGIGPYGQEDYVKLEGPAATKYIDDMLAAQIRYQQEPKNDGAWLKTR